MKFIVLLALFAVAAADSYRSAEYVPSYEGPTFQTTRFEEVRTAKPYDFSWAVKDDATYNDFDHSESSDGKVTTGSYRVVLPDGRTQVVTYRADSYGYTADVKYIGEAKFPDFVESNYRATTHSVPVYRPSTATNIRTATHTFTRPTSTATMQTSQPFIGTTVDIANPAYQTLVNQPNY